MKKLLGILVLDMLLSSNANALVLSCKSKHNGEIITDHTYDLSRGSKWEPKYTDTHIYWRVWKSNPDDVTLAMAVYNSVDRYSGAFLQRVTADAPISEHAVKNRNTAKIEATFNGTCTKYKKKY